MMNVRIVGQPTVASIAAKQPLRRGIGLFGP
jgi:hypothetical protein